MTNPDSLPPAPLTTSPDRPTRGTVLILGASALQVPMIERARQLGLRTLVVDADTHAPGAALADEFYPVSTVDTEAIVELTRHRELVGATTVGTDAPIRSVAAVAAEHGLRSISVETARVCTDKLLQAQALARAGIRTHRFALASTVDELRRAVEETGLPCIVKPLDSSGSRGVVRVDDVDDLASALRYALAPSERQQVIVEELLVGREISCEVLCIEGEFHVVSTTDKETTGSPHFIETGHTQPAALDETALAEVHELVRDALRAVGVDFGPAHIELMVTEHGPAVIELGARLPGDFLSSHLIPMSTGTDLIGLVLRQACGERIEMPPSTKRGGALRFLHAEPGTLVAYHGLERAGCVDGVSTIMLQAAPGHVISGMHSSTDRLGVIVAGGADRSAAARACEEARDLISVEVAPPAEPAPPSWQDAGAPARPAADQEEPSRLGPSTTSLPALGRRVLVIGAGRGQVGLIRALKRLGATTVVASLTEGAPPGLVEADEVIPVNILAVNDVIDGARLADVDAVATSCLDTGLEALGGVVDALGLRGFGRDTARLCSDKLAMKRRFEAHDVPTAVFRLVTSPELVPSALEATGLPAMVKATDLQGSSGVFKVSTVKEALAAFAWARGLSRRGTVIIERFLDGRELGAQAFVHDGEVIHTTVHGDILAPGPVPAPVAHYLPLDAADSSPAGPDLVEQADHAVHRAVRALGLDNCAVNVDLIVSGGTVHVIELTGRAGANGLPELMSAAHGLDYYELIAREALNLDVPGTWAARKPWDGAVLGEMIIDPTAYGTLTSVSCPERLPDWVVDLSLFRSVGDVLQGFSSSGDCLGQIVVRGKNLEECRQRVNRIRAEISLVTQELP